MRLMLATNPIATDEGPTMENKRALQSLKLPDSKNLKDVEPTLSDYSQQEVLSQQPHCDFRNMKKKILILSANPKNTDKLRLDEEVREIQSGLERAKSRDKFEIITRWAVRPDDLRRALLDYEPEIVHFSGHGGGAEGLALENNSGQVQLVSTEALARLFKLFQGKTECVLLNACYSEAQALAIHQHVNFVVGMNKAIGDLAAIEFAVGFYDALGADRCMLSTLARIRLRKQNWRSCGS